MKNFLLVSLLLVLSVAVWGENQSCGNQIPACGCEVTRSESYFVTKDLSSKGTCLVVTANRAKLYTQGHTISGSSKGAGIRVKGDRNLIDGVKVMPTGAGGAWSAVQNFEAGIRVTGDGNTIDGFVFQHNTVGLSFHGDNNRASYFEAEENTIAVFVRGCSNMIGGGSYAASNSLAGVLLDEDSRDNLIIDNEFLYNGSGILAQKGSRDNIISGNMSWYNGIDEYDGNKMTKNEWNVNSFVTAAGGAK